MTTERHADMPTIELVDEEAAQSNAIKFLDQHIFENSYPKIETPP
jgi:hypothetical protein